MCDSAIIVVALVSTMTSCSFSNAIYFTKQYSFPFWNAMQIKPPSRQHEVCDVAYYARTPPWLNIFFLSATKIHFLVRHFTRLTIGGTFMYNIFVFVKQ